MFLYIVIFFSLVLILGLMLYILFLIKSMNEKKGEDQSFLMLQNQLNSMTSSLDKKLSESNEMIQRQFNQGSEVIRQVTEKLTRLDETNNKVVGFAQQLQRLEYVLRNPKQRGIYGEYILENILGNVLPPGNFKTQYRFNDGEIVDSIIIVGDKIVPIDAKFSLAKYHQYLDIEDKPQKEKLDRELAADLKLRINETSKYIRPAEKTTGFALMFIPGEGVFYHLLDSNSKSNIADSQPDIIAYAFSKNVILVSPSNLFAYLQVILQALHALQVKDSIDDILNQVRKLVKHVGLYDEYMRRLGKNMQTVIGSYNDAYQNLKLINNDIKKLTPDIKSEIEPAFLDKNQVDNGINR